MDTATRVVARRRYFTPAASRRYARGGMARDGRIRTPVMGATMAEGDGAGTGGAGTGDGGSGGGSGGGAGGNDPATQPGTGGGNTGGTGDGGSGAGQGDGDKGKGGDQGRGSQDAVLADLAKERDRRQAAEKRAREHEQALEKIKRESMSDQERAVAEARDAALTEANTRLIRAEVLVAASAAGFRDAKDAVGHLDLSSIIVDKDGNVDTDTVKAKVGEIAKSKPYLLRDGAGDEAKPPRGGGDHTGGSGNGNGQQPPSMNDIIRGRGVPIPG